MIQAASQILMAASASDTVVAALLDKVDDRGGDAFSQNNSARSGGGVTGYRVVSESSLEQLSIPSNKGSGEGMSGVGRSAQHSFGKGNADTDQSEAMRSINGYEGSGKQGDEENDDMSATQSSKNNTDHAEEILEDARSDLSANAAFPAVRLVLYRLLRSA